MAADETIHEDGSWKEHAQNSTSEEPPKPFQPHSRRYNLSRLSSIQDLDDAAVVLKKRVSSK